MRNLHGSGILRQAVRNGIRALGYDVIRYARPRCLQREEGHSAVVAPLAVFFLGAQGVGKTSLALEVAKLSKNQTCLITQEQRLNPAGSQWVISEGEIPTVYKALLELKLQGTVKDSQRSIYSKFVHLYWTYWVTMNHLWMKSRVATCIPLVDSSFFQHFVSEMCVLDDSDASAFSGLVADSVFIHCVADTGTILDHIAMRKEKHGRWVSAHWGKNEEQLAEFTDRRLSEISRFMDLVRKRGGACLEIDASKEIRGNAQKVWDFIRAEVALRTK